MSDADIHGLQYDLWWESRYGESENEQDVDPDPDDSDETEGDFGGDLPPD